MCVTSFKKRDICRVEIKSEEIYVYFVSKVNDVSNVTIVCSVGIVMYIFNKL